MTAADLLERALPDALEAIGRRDASDVVEAALVRTVAMPQRSRWRNPSWWLERLRPNVLAEPMTPALRIALVAMLVLALLASIAAVGAALLQRTPDPLGLAPGSWEADQPLSMNFGDPSGPARLTLTVTDDRRILVSSTSHGAVDWLRGSVEMEGRGVVRLTTTPWTAVGRGRNDGVTTDLNDGRGRHSLGPCAAGDVGRYLWTEEPGRRWQVLTPLGDACAARQAVLTNGDATRTWFAVSTTTARATVMLDTFRPAIAFPMPGEGESLLTSTSSSATAAAVDGSVTVRAFLDPSPFRDPCDARSGWVPRTDAGMDLIDLLESAPAFVVSDVRTGSVDGQTARFARVEAASPSPCADRINAAWQGGYETTGAVRSMLPGEHVFLALVSGPDWTVLFDITLAADPPDTTEAEAILASVRFQP
jgi:hypothetical protein